MTNRRASSNYGWCMFISLILAAANLVVGDQALTIAFCITGAVSSWFGLLESKKEL